MRLLVLRISFCAKLVLASHSLTGQVVMDSLLTDNQYLDKLVIDQLPKLQIDFPSLRKEKIGGKLSLNTQFNQFPIDTVLMNSHVFTTINGQLNGDVLGLPLTINLRLGVRDNAVIRGVSGVSVRFDARQYKRKLVEDKLQNAKDVDGYMNALPARVNMSKMEKDIFQQDLKQQALNKLFADPAIQKKRIEMQDKMELYVSCITDSVKNSLDTMGYDNCKRFLEKTNNLHAYYDSVTVLKQGYENRIVGVQKQIQELSASKGVGQYSKKFVMPKSFSLKERLFSSIDAFDVGNFSYRLNEFGMHGLPQKGANVQFNSGKLLSGISYGFQNLSSSLSVWNYSSYWDTLNSGRVLVANLGYGDLNSNYIRASYLEGNSGTLVDSANLYLPKQNRVVSFEVQRKLTNAFVTKLELANSYQNYFKSPISEAHINNTIPIQDRAALAYSFEYKPLKNKRIAVKLGYHHVGAWFYSIGNPYLLNNRDAIKTSVRGEVFKSKVQGEISLINALSRSQRNVSRLTNRQFQFNGNLNIRVKSLNLNFVASPCRLVNYTNGFRSQVVTTVYSALTSMQKNVSKYTIQSNLLLTNFANEAIFRDTSFATSNILMHFRSSFGAKSKSWKLVTGVMHMHSPDKARGYSFNYEAGYANRISRVDAVLSLVHGKLPMDTVVKSGFKADFTTKSKVGLSLALKCQIRWEFVHAMDNPDYIGSLNLMYNLK